MRLAGDGVLEPHVLRRADDQSAKDHGRLHGKHLGEVVRGLRPVRHGRMHVNGEHHERACHRLLAPVGDDINRWAERQTLVAQVVKSVVDNTDQGRAPDELTPRLLQPVGRRERVGHLGARGHLPAGDHGLPQQALRASTDYPCTELLQDAHRGLRKAGNDVHQTPKVRGSRLVVVFTPKTEANLKRAPDVILDVGLLHHDRQFGQI